MPIFVGKDFNDDVNSIVEFDGCRRRRQRLPAGGQTRGSAPLGRFGR